MARNLVLTESTAALTGIPIAGLTGSDDQNLYRRRHTMRKNSQKKPQDASQTAYFKMLASLRGADKTVIGRGKRKPLENYVAILGYD